MLFRSPVEAKDNSTESAKADAEKSSGSIRNAQIPAVPGTAYSVTKGDCLWNIAQRAYGDGSRWVEIYALNAGSISDPGLINIGQVLVLPAA